MRKMAYLRMALLLAVVVAFVGCQGGSEAVKVDAPQSSPGVENAKAALNDIAESGELGSAAMTVRENLEASEEGKALLPELDALEAMTDPAQIEAKAKAKEIADRL